MARQQNNDTLVKYPIMGMSQNTDQDFLDAADSLFQDIDNLIEPNDGYAQDRPGFQTLLTGLTAPYAWGAGDFDIPDSTDHVTPSRYRIYLVQDWETSQFVFKAFSYNYATKTFSSIVSISEAGGSGLSLGYYTAPRSAMALCGFLVEGYKEYALPILQADLADIRFDTWEDQFGNSQPYFSISLGAKYNTRPLVFMFINRYTPFGEFGDNNNAQYWWFGLETYTLNELYRANSQWITSQATGILAQSSIPLGTNVPPFQAGAATLFNDVNLPIPGKPVVAGEFPLPSGVYEFVQVAEFENGETVIVSPPIKVTQAFETNVNQPNPAISSVFLQTTLNESATYSPVRPKDIRAFHWAVRFTPSNSIGVLPRYTLAVNITEEDRRKLEQQKASEDKFVGWEDYRIIRNSRIAINATKWNTGNTFTPGISQFSDKRSVAWEGKVRLVNGTYTAQMELYPETVKNADGTIRFSFGAFKQMQVLLKNNTTGQTYLYYGKSTGLIQYGREENATEQGELLPYGHGYILPLASNYDGTGTVSVVDGVYDCQIGYGWYVSADNRYSMFQFYDIINQVDSSRIVDDFNRVSAQPRYNNRITVGQQVFISDIYIENDGVPIHNTNAVGVKQSALIMGTVGDSVTGVMRKRYFTYKKKVQGSVLGMRSFNLVTAITPSQQTTELAAVTENSIEMFKLEEFTLNFRQRFVGYGGVSQRATAIYDNRLYFVNKLCQLWRFDGVNNPICVCHPIQADVDAITALDTTGNAILFTELQNVIIDGISFLLWAIPLGITTSATPPAKTQKTVTVPATIATVNQANGFLWNAKAADGDFEKAWTQVYATNGVKAVNLWNVRPDLNGRGTYLGGVYFQVFDETTRLDSGSTNTAVPRTIQTEMLYINGRDRFKDLIYCQIEGSGSIKTITFTDQAGNTMTRSNVTLPYRAELGMPHKGVKVKLSATDPTTVAIREISLMIRDYGGI